MIYRGRQSTRDQAARASSTRREVTVSDHLRDREVHRAAWPAGG